MTTETRNLSAKVWAQYKSDADRQKRDYLRCHRDITILSVVCVALVIVLITACTYYFSTDNFVDARSFLIPLVAACSALLICKTAERQLRFQTHIEINKNTSEAIRVTHYLIAVLSDIINRLNYSSELLSQDKTHLLVLCENIDRINDRFEKLFDESLYNFFPSSAIEMLGGLTGHIFGMKVSMDVLKTNIANTRPNSNIGNFLIGQLDPAARKNVVATIKSSEKDFEECRCIITELRRSFG